METLKKKITEHILKIVSNKTIKIIVCDINAYTDLASEKYNNVPHLDISTIIKNGNEFDIALKTAIDQDEFEYISDLYGFEDDEYIEEEIALDLIYFPDWPNNIDDNDAIIISILKEIVDKNTNLFNHIERFYFHHFGELDLVTILKK
ncbi:hypothetical protein [Olleya sp. HaHaR_3_96]|uniref:hypothetical protein n=1 Tax=Olleya sp. HaHaR_3_96 TaxID=2745560 RepID=UPI001C4F4607|nr:hypothetical protein [Olleya sp. HaHaR_3_96]QXP61547.1 hypothetical protein H0I26_07935 [Olleya sp. HaHaR_3_96]